MKKILNCCFSQSEGKVLNQLTCLLVIFFSLILVSQAVAKNEPVVEKAMLTQLMQALAQNNYDDFISNGTEKFKNGITTSAFESVVKQLGGFIQGGYKTEYLEELTQQGYKSYVWKISYENSRDNTLAKLVVVDGKVAGFWLQ